MRIIFEKETLEAVKKSAFFAERGKRILKSKASSGSDEKFLYFKKKIIAHLNRLEEKEDAGINKAYIIEDMILKGGLPIGTIREWKGKKYIKIAPGKWKPKYDSETRGAKLSIAALKRKAEKCSSSQELLQLVLENRSRFSDKDGNPLPFVQQLSEFISQTQQKKNSAGSGGGDDGYPEKNYPEYKGKGQEAVNFIVKQQGGQVRGAFNRHEIGDIDVVWGKITDKEKHTGYGLSHIIDKHGMDAARVIGEVIEYGKVVNPTQGRISIQLGYWKVALKQQFNGNKKIWIVTSFKNEDRGQTTTPSPQSDYTKGTNSETSTTSIPQSDEKSSNKADKNAEANGSVNKKTGKFNTIEEVKNFYKRSEKWLKAPNGKNTNLSEKQWLQVRTTNFKNWFGDWENDPKNASKIVDENGEPLVVYHYTDNKFTEFNKNNVRGGKYGEGFYFAPKKLKEYGKYKMECFLNIRNIPEENPKSNWTFENWHIYGAESIVREFGNEDDMREFENISNKIIDTINNGKVDDTEPLYRERMKLTDKILKRNNYDGLIADKFIKEIIAIEPHQIKSATRNNGSFDINSANINKSIVWLQNYLPKNKRDAENSIEFLRRWRERKNRA